MVGKKVQNSKELILILLVHTTLFHIITAQVTLFSYGSQHGDTVISDSGALTEGSMDSGVKVVATPKTPFFHREDTRIQISTNGYVSFGHEIYNNDIPQDFPVQYDGLYVPIIASFWTDFLYKEGSKLLYQVHRDIATLHRIKNIISQRFPAENFNPTHALIVTWNNVEHEEATGSFTFQLVFASDGASTHVINLYETLPLGVKAAVGYQQRLNIYSEDHSMERSIGRNLLESTNTQTNGMHVYKVATEKIDCSGKPDGKNPHPSDCNRFIMCSNGQVMETRQCAVFTDGFGNNNTRQNFNPLTGECVPEQQYACNQDVTANCLDAGETNVEHGTTCKKFVHCRFNKVIKISTCPENTVFHPKFKVCVWESQYTCPYTTPTDPIPPERPFCEDKVDGNYADPKDCNKFTQCTNGLYHEMTCPTGLHFIPSGLYGYCDWAFNSNCKT